MTLRDDILQAIETGQVTMRPKWHFILRGALLFVGAALAALTLLYLASFIIFVLRETGAWFVPGFGPRAFGEFFRSLPWILIVTAAVFVVLLEILVRRYSFAYGRPLLYSAAAIVLFVAIGGFAVAHTPFHRGLFQQARENRLPLAGGLYRGYGLMRPENVIIGTVAAMTATGFRVCGRHEEVVEVVVTPETKFFDDGPVAVGDRVAVFGEHQEGGIIKALGVREVDFDEMPFSLPSWHMK